MQSGDLLSGVYRILEPIGSGGLGTIYLAYHENLQKYVVVKKVKDHCVGVINIRGEADILKSLHHMYLPQVYDFVQVGDEVFTVMDYISGHDLKYYIDQGYVFSEAQLITWMHQLLDVLSYLHGGNQKILHCDIKPANIMITEEQNVCLIDFNISLDGENNKDLIGLSNHFASPEQVKKADLKMRYGSGDAVTLDERSDLYSLGAVFYYLMTGIMPDARRENFLPIRLVDKSMNPYSEGLTNIVDKAMRENPARRFKNAPAMEDALWHMERYTDRYRRLTIAGYAMDIAAFVLAVVLVCVMIVGWRAMRRDQFFEAYDAYMEAAGILNEVTREDTEEGKAEIRSLAMDGIALLNEGKYQKLFSDYPVDRANVLYAVGAAFLRTGDPAGAVDYFETALNDVTDNGAIYRDLAIAYAEGGDRSGAEWALGKARVCGVSQEELDLIRAEIAYTESDYAAAYDYGCMAAESADAGIYSRAALIAVDSAQKAGRLLDCMDFSMAMAGKVDRFTRIFWLREGCEACVRAMDEGEVPQDSQRQAIAAYEEIVDSGMASLTDGYNLAYLYEAADQLTKCRDWLLEMRKLYPDAYEVCLRLSYISYRMENQDGPGDYTQAMLYFEKAKDLCEADGTDWKSDAQMVQMSGIIEDIRARQEDAAQNAEETME